MPIYCYRRVDNQKIIERYFSSWDEQDSSCVIQDGRKGIIDDDGVFAVRDLAFEKKDMKTFSNYPCFGGDALAVNPEQAVEAEESARKNGVPTMFCKKTGRPWWESAEHRKKYCEKYGYYDKNSYGTKLEADRDIANKNVREAEAAVATSDNSEEFI